MSLNQFLVIISILSVSAASFAQSWSATTVLSCSNKDVSAPFQKLEIVNVKRMTDFYVVRIFKQNDSKYYYENYASTPTQHNKVIYSSYQTTSDKEKVRFELMIHIPSLEAYVFFESNKRPLLSTAQPRVDFNCQIVAPHLIAKSSTP